MSYPVMNANIPWSLIKKGFGKTPHFNTLTQKSASGRGTSSISLQPYATWDFEVDLNMVDGGEAVRYSTVQQFLGLFMKCCGSGGFFLFTDPNDNSVQNPTNGDPYTGILLNVTPGAAAPMGQTGDGVSTQFQYARNIDIGVDILQNIVGGAQIYVDGVPTAAATSATGVATFATPPAIGAPITWEGNFQYLCQFTDDTIKGLARVNKNCGGYLWSASSVAFTSVFV